MSTGKRALWRRYWRAVHAVDATARSPEDAFTDWLVERASRGRWLDAGCGRRSIPDWREGDLGALRSRNVGVFGCDLDHAAVCDRARTDRVCTASLTALPFRDESFSLVTSNMVFEHLTEPAASVAELVRVTVRGGRIIVHTVNRRHYLALLARVTPFRFHRWIVALIEGRDAKDVYPTQYRINTPDELRQAFARWGADVVRGGELDGIPMFVPYPGLFWLAIGFGLLERALARLPLLRRFLRPNLLMEFERR